MAGDAAKEAPPESGRRLLLGLGNPGSEYRDTRHNLGARVVEELARRAGRELAPGECRSLFSRAEGYDLAVPQTYMNRSGFAARCLCERYGYRPQDVLVIFDDLSLPVGKLRLRASGSPGGHRGMESVLESLRTGEVPRLRLGIAPVSQEGEAVVEEPEDVVDFVLSPFSEGEIDRIEEEITRAADACEYWLEHGVTATMNRFNG